MLPCYCLKSVRYMWTSICVMSTHVTVYVCVYVCVCVCGSPLAICALCWFTVLGASAHKQGHVFICCTHWRTDSRLLSWKKLHYEFLITPITLLCGDSACVCPCVSLKTLINLYYSMVWLNHFYTADTKLKVPFVTEHWSAEHHQQAYHSSNLLFDTNLLLCNVYTSLQDQKGF